MGAGTWESHHAITSLMYRYAECVDQADFDGLAQLFAHGRMRSTASQDPEDGMDGEHVARFYARTNRVHEDGTLRTRHVTSNMLIDIDEAADRARARSYYLVLQATKKLPFQPIVAGRYDDEFWRSDGEWHFRDRVVHVDQIGDMSEHLSFDLAAGNVTWKSTVGDEA